LLTKISVKEGEIVACEKKKTYTYEGNTIEYYLLDLKNAEIGTDKVDTMKIRLSNAMKIRLSNALFNNKSLKIGDVIYFKGKLVEDKFQGLVVKFIRNVTTEKGEKFEETKTKEPVEKQWTIQSSSDVNKVYTVTLKADGSWMCTCPHFTFRKKLCKHISDCKMKS